MYINTIKKTSKNPLPNISLTKALMLFLIFATTFSACKKDKEAVPELPKPTATNVEIGSGDKRALRGRDFHFNADVIAADKIKQVKVNILQKSGEKYTASWKFELIWAEYVSAKNTNVHKHFTIPADAPEGKYDFVFTVLDENGSTLEIKEDLNIIDPTNLPVDPKIGRDMLQHNGKIIYSEDKWKETDKTFKKGDVLNAHVRISEISGDGILYSVLIKRKLNHTPETIDKLDLSKAIVISKVEHIGLAAASKITTLEVANGIVYGIEKITIGADKDNNKPTQNAITGDKAWESGQYNWLILYKNTSHNISVYKSIPITIDYK